MNPAQNTVSHSNQMYGFESTDKKYRTTDNCPHESTSIEVDEICTWEVCDICNQKKALRFGGLSVD